MTQKTVSKSQDGRAKRTMTDFEIAKEIASEFNSIYFIKEKDVLEHLEEHPTNVVITEGDPEKGVMSAIYRQFRNLPRDRRFDRPVE